MAQARLHLDWASGVVAGSANIITGFPFDLVKVRLQADSCRYPGPWQCARSIVRFEGVRGLYRGLSPQLLGGALETGINYAVYRSSLQALQAAAPLPGPVAVPLAAATAGLALSCVLSPAELVKCRLQLGAADPLHCYSGPLDCLRQLLREEGWRRGLGRGLGATMAREVPGNAIYFSTYAALRYAFPGTLAQRKADEPRTLLQMVLAGGAAIVCGGIAGMVMWLCILPVDAAKTRIQTAHPGSASDVGIRRQLAVMLAEGGVPRLYAGLGPTLVRAFPANAAQWLAWEFCQDQFYRVEA